MPDTAEAPTERIAPDHVPAVGETGRRALGVEVRTSDDGRRSSFLFMTGDLARDGMVIDPAGVDVGAYLRNPVVLWEHGYDFARGGVPVGRATNVSRTENGWSAEVEWEEDEFALRIAGMVKRGTLSAVSFGWRTLAREWQTMGGQEVMVVTRCEMMEFSVVSVPADAGALVMERAEGAALGQIASQQRAILESLAALSADVSALTQRLGTPPEGSEVEATEVPETEEPEEVAEEPAEHEPPVEPPPAEPPAPPRTATPEEALRQFAAMIPALDEAYERAMGRA